MKLTFSKSVSGILNLTGLPTLTVSASCPVPESPNPDDVKKFDEYFKIQGIVPILFQLWEQIPYPDSSTTEYWAWFAFYPGIDLSIQSFTSGASGLFMVATSGHFGLIDGGARIEIDHQGLQAELLRLVELLN
jgi:hypothetical protein